MLRGEDRDCCMNRDPKAKDSLNDFHRTADV